MRQILEAMHAYPGESLALGLFVLILVDGLFGGRGPVIRLPFKRTPKGRPPSNSV